MTITVRPLGPKMWDDVETLFGKNGACGGCWCMFWRVEKGEKWDDLQGPPAKKRFKKLVETGAANGIVAYADGEPIGWCSLGKRTAFAKLDRAPSLKVEDADAVWSLPCFFVKAGHRGRGVATAMLAAATKEVQKLGGKLAEAYPLPSPKAGEKKIPAAFAFTGTTALFEKLGFKAADPAKTKGKVRMRKKLK